MGRARGNGFLYHQWREEWEDLFKVSFKDSCTAIICIYIVRVSPLAILVHHSNHTKTIKIRSHLFFFLFLFWCLLNYLAFRGSVELLFPFNQSTQSQCGHNSPLLPYSGLSVKLVRRSKNPSASLCAVQGSHTGEWQAPCTPPIPSSRYQIRLKLCHLCVPGEPVAVMYHVGRVAERPLP